MLCSVPCEECTLVGPDRALDVFPFATRIESRIGFLRSRFPVRGGSKSGMEGCREGFEADTISGTACEE